MMDAPVRSRILWVAAVVMPYPSCAVLGRVVEAFVEETPKIQIASGALQEMNTNRVIAWPLVHPLCRNAGHVDGPVIYTDPDAMTRNSMQ